MPNTREKEKLIELLNGVQKNGVIFTPSQVDERYGYKKDISNAKVADHLIANGVTVQEWIPVTERLPFAEYGESDDVLALTEFGMMRTLYFDGGNWCFQSGDPYLHKVTHWMPLPDPPKGE